MIHYMLQFYFICHLFVYKHAEPIIGLNVWPAAPQNFTFIASIGLKNSTPFHKRLHFCGGSLITKQHVLTASHCLVKYSIGEIDVIIGEVNLSQPSPRYNVRGWITYNQWAMQRGRMIQYMSNDIAIVLLQTPADRPGMKPVVLTDLNNERLYRTSAIIVGWGITIRGSVSHVLLRARVTILTPQECSEKIKLIINKHYFIRKNYICSWAEPYAITGRGDSGGPLLSHDNVLLGVMSSQGPNETQQWGNFPVEFLNQYKVILHVGIDYYRDFIEDLMSSGATF